MPDDKAEDDKPKHEIEHAGEIDLNINWGWGGLFFIGAIFFWFWAQNGWYRVDCALKIQTACDLIQMEYVAKKP